MLEKKSPEPAKPPAERKPPPRIINRKDSSDESISPKRVPYRRSPSPRRRSVSPRKRISPRRRSQSPVRRRSPSPVRRRSPSPVRRRSPSPVRRRSPIRKRASSVVSVGSRSPSPRRRKRTPTPPKPVKLCVSNLTRNVNKDHILEIFSVYGRVRSIDLPLDTKNYLPRGHAYVEFDKTDDAKDAIKHMDGGWIDGQEVTAKEVLAMPDTAALSGNRNRADTERQRNIRRRSPPRFNRRPPPRRSRSPRRSVRSPAGPIGRRRRGSLSSGSSSRSPPPRKRSPPSVSKRRRYSRSTSDSD